MTHWSQDSIFYHIYPLGLCDAPATNDFSSPAVSRLDKIFGWLDHIQRLGANAIYFGPVFESSRHGYDTADYNQVDRRLGSNEDLARLSQEIHRRGMKLVLDGVFNHVGREFWAFRDVRSWGRDSAYCDWFTNLRFDAQSPYGDPFSYDGWNGHYSLVRLNPWNRDVRRHLFDAVAGWMRDFEIDGLRLDTADCLEPDFMRDLASFCRALRPDFWLMGEVIHGDYRRWANPAMLDSVTNYECYKGLYSSHVDKNYFEIAYALQRQFGSGGIYNDLPLYNFADNHDVNRVASQLKDPAHIFPLYCLLMTMPGIPSVYYGSEWGILGERTATGDSDLRPSLVLEQVAHSSPNPDLAKVIARLAQIRHNRQALRRGDYHQLHINHEQLAFQRQWQTETVIVAVNASRQPVDLQLAAPFPDGTLFADDLNPDNRFSIRAGKLNLSLAPAWGRVLVRL